MITSKPQMSLKIRWMIWRARMSIPCQLAQADERKVISKVTAANGGLSIITISLLAWLSGLPLLFAALGPTAFILFSAPMSRAAAPRSVVLGHFVGIGCGYACFHVGKYVSSEVLSINAGEFFVLVNASFALAASCFLLVRLSCPHAPACASALIIALGAVTTLAGVIYMAIAVVLMTAQAVAINRLACLPVPLWSPRKRPADGPCHTDI